VKSLLNNHFFNVVASPSEADIIVTLDNKCRKGNTVPGELYNFIEFFSTLGIKIENNRTGQILLNYSINDERTLVPENKSASQGKNMAARELIKRLNREFARELKKITFDRTGKIPERQKMLPDVPVPVVGPSVPEKEADPVISVPVVVPEVIPAPLVPVKSAKPENQKAIRVEWLVEAREFAMDAENSNKKHAAFGKYKGRINNYLAKRGYNLTKEREEWAKRVKARGGTL
jgi:hypothetical protein